MFQAICDGILYKQQATHRSLYFFLEVHAQKWKENIKIICDILLLLELFRMHCNISVVAFHKSFTYVSWHHLQVHVLARILDSYYIW